jgi:very-short-patch-repair endonuclease
MELKWERARKLRNRATEAERHLWHYLRRGQLAGWKFRRQYPIAGFIVDFVCIPARLVIELDGGQHADACCYDDNRTRLLKAEGFRVVRFWNDDVLVRVDAVLEQILRHLGET